MRRSRKRLTKIGLSLSCWSLCCLTPCYIVHESIQYLCVCAVQQLAVPCRRLVCYCRLCEVADIAKKENLDRHQREMFLFNDVLLVMLQRLFGSLTIWNRLPFYCRSATTFDSFKCKLNKFSFATTSQHTDLSSHHRQRF